VSAAFSTSAFACSSRRRLKRLADEPPDLRRDQALTLEHADGVAAETHEQDADNVILGQRREQWGDVDKWVFAFMGDPERRAHGHGLVLEREADEAFVVLGRALATFERLEALANVRAEDVAACFDAQYLPRQIGTLRSRRRPCATRKRRDPPKRASHSATEGARGFQF
jgi:hypothetical protein